MLYRKPRRDAQSRTDGVDDGKTYPPPKVRRWIDWKAASRMTVVARIKPRGGCGDLIRRGPAEVWIHAHCLEAAQEVSTATRVGG